MIQDSSYEFGFVCISSHPWNPLNEGPIQSYDFPWRDKEALWVFSLLSLYLPSWLERGQKATAMSSSAQLLLLPKDIAANTQKNVCSTQPQKTR